MDKPPLWVKFANACHNLSSRVAVPTIIKLHKVTGRAGYQLAWPLFYASFIWAFTTDLLLGFLRSNPTTVVVGWLVNVFLIWIYRPYFVKGVAEAEDSMEKGRLPLSLVVEMPIRTFLTTFGLVWMFLGVVLGPAAILEGIHILLLALGFWAYCLPIGPGKSLWSRVKDKVKNFAKNLVPKPALQPAPVGA